MKEYKVKVYENGTKEWFLNDLRHREDGPAIECSNGDKMWFLNDIRHREDGPAEEFSDGNKMWFVNGLRHRADGPAMEFSDGTKIWYVNGKLHREDGPAIEYRDGTVEYWIDGVQLNKKEFEARNKKTYHIPISMFVKASSPEEAENKLNLILFHAYMKCVLNEHNASLVCDKDSIEER